MKPVRVGEPFDAINDAFHQCYESAVAVAKLEAPLLIVLGDVLIVRRGDARSEKMITPPMVHVIKSVAHWPIAVFVVADDARATAPIDLHALRERVAKHASSFEAEAAQCQTILDVCAAFIDGPMTQERTALFAREVGAMILRITDAATKIQLTALDDATAEVLEEMSDDERRAFEVIVAGEHQARARNLPMQYFKKLVGESTDRDERVAYAEGVQDEASVLSLAGKRRVDRDLALAFFGDAKRLQRDVLGDSAKRLFEQLTLKARCE